MKYLLHAHDVLEAAAAAGGKLPNKHMQLSSWVRGIVIYNNSPFTFTLELQEGGIEISPPFTRAQMQTSIRNNGGLEIIQTALLDSSIYIAGEMECYIELVEYDIMPDFRPLSLLPVYDIRGKVSGG